VTFTVDAAPTLVVNSAMIGAASSHTNGGSGGGAGAGGAGVCCAGRHGARCWIVRDRYSGTGDWSGYCGMGARVQCCARRVRLGASRGCCRAAAVGLTRLRLCRLCGVVDANGYVDLGGYTQHCVYHLIGRLDITRVYRHIILGGFVLYW
jgi:hypothetical protein